MITSDVCNLCGVNDFSLMKTRLRDGIETYKVYQCKKCGHVQLLPRPSEEEDGEFYARNMQDKSRNKLIDYNVLRSNNMFDTRRYLRRINSLVPDKDIRVLDIGAGYGFFVDALCKEGFRNVTGAEISEERRALAEAFTEAPIVDYDVSRPGHDIGTFDIITLFHVLEHLADPVSFLRGIKRLLKPDGIFVCEVPNVSEMLLGICPAYNDFYWIRAHLNYFRKETLSDCFRRAGYDDVEMRFEQRYGLANLLNWLMTGKPQIERPIFETGGFCRPIESFYRRHLEKRGKSDALIAIAKI